MRILIIDDEPKQYKSFDQRLKIEYPNVQIDYAKSAISGIDRCKNRCYELIILDQVMGGGNKDGTAFLRRIKQKAIETIPDIIFVTGHYNSLPISEILTSDVPITLFLEKDQSFQDMLLVATQLIIRRIDTEVRYDPKDLYGDQFIELILKEAHEIINQEHPGYIGITQQRQIGTLVRSYLQSLKMRSVWNGDDVLELTIFFAQSMCRVFDIHVDLIEVLRKFLNLEEVLYSIPYYRDHFFHQIKVFFLGFCIINNLSRHHRLRNTVFDKPNGMKLWFLASAFHDLGYPYEKMSRWLNDFIEGTLRSPGDTDFNKKIIPIDFHWGALLGKRFHSYHMDRVAKSVCQINGKDTPEVLAELLSEFMSLVVDKPDHGLYSSLITQNYLRYRLSDDEVDPVSVAIALHNDDVARIVKSILGSQTFEKDPLSFLLAFCDLAQDWGRFRPVRLSKSGYSKFGYPVYDSNSLFDESTNTIRVVLRYQRDFSMVERRDWTDNIYEVFIEPTRNNWSVGSQQLNFCIDYCTTSPQDPILAHLTF